MEERGGAEQVETILYGKSFGCAMAIESYLQAPVGLHESVILESTFTSVPDVYLRILPCKIGKFLRLHRLSKIGWRNDQRIGDITAPILFISGTKDRLTPNSMTYELHERATRSVRKHIYNVKNGKHTALYKTDL